MKFWPFEKRESSYTDAIITAILANAQGKSLAATPAATSALEACAGTTGRGFAAAEVSGQASITQALTPSVLSMIGRELIRTGEAIFMIDTNALASSSYRRNRWDVEGDPDPDSWEYSLTLGGPSRTSSPITTCPAAGVLHFKYAVDPSRPWRGNGPVQVAALAGKLSAETVRALADESSGPVGRLLGIPSDGGDATVAGLKQDIANARGKTALIETGDWGSSDNARLQLKSERFGAEPTPGLVTLMSVASQEIYSACGYNGALWGGSSSAAVREAWRLALFGVLSPLGKLVEEELQSKLEDTVTLSWQELRASDLSGRARSVQSLVGAGVSVQAAAKEAGLMVDFQAEPTPMVEGDSRGPEKTE